MQLTISPNNPDRKIYESMQANHDQDFVYKKPKGEAEPVYSDRNLQPNSSEMSSIDNNVAQPDKIRKNSNRAIVIGIIWLILIGCCCLTAYSVWNYGDTIIEWFEDFAFYSTCVIFG